MCRSSWEILMQDSAKVSLRIWRRNKVDQCQALKLAAMGVQWRRVRRPSGGAYTPGSAGWVLLETRVGRGGETG